MARTRQIRAVLITAVFLMLALRPTQAQTPPPNAVVHKTISSIEDIEIGMSADLVIAGLTKRGYGLEAVGSPTDAAQWNVSYKEKRVGSFFAEKGRVTSAEISLYNSQDPPKNSPGAIGFAEALYWILYDSGSP